MRCKVRVLRLQRAILLNFDFIRIGFLFPVSVKNCTKKGCYVLILGVFGFVNDSYPLSQDYAKLCLL